MFAHNIESVLFELKIRILSTNEYKRIYFFIISNNRASAIVKITLSSIKTIYKFVKTVK